MSDLKNLQILNADFHRNGVGGAPFKVALVDDPNDGDVKLVIMFAERYHTAVLSLDKLIQNEDIAFGSNSYRGDRFDDELRPELWQGEEGE
jgi:hypothetical protein